MGWGGRGGSTRGGMHAGEGGQHRVEVGGRREGGRRGRAQQLQPFLWHQWKPNCTQNPSSTLPKHTPMHPPHRTHTAPTPHTAPVSPMLAMKVSRVGSASMPALMPARTTCGKPAHSAQEQAWRTSVVSGGAGAEVTATAAGAAVQVRQRAAAHVLRQHAPQPPGRAAQHSMAAGAPPPHHPNPRTQACSWPRVRS